MKTLISVLFVIAILLCSAALAEAKTITPVDPGYDLSALADGIYPVYFDQDAVADSKAVLSIYSEDMFDIVDILDVHVVGTGSALHTAVICFYLSN